LSLVTRHSYRSAIIGSTFVARCAGSQQASNATTVSNSAITMNVNGSVALTPNNRVFINCVNATDATKPNTTPEQAEADLDTCKEIARAQEDTDAKIDQDTSATMDDSSQGAVDTELSQNMSSQRSGKRFGSIVDDCMRQLGYSPAN